ncbi:AAEL017040-PA, partial [Aedes aegypti]
MFRRASNIYDSFRSIEVFLKLLGVLPLIWVDSAITDKSINQKLLNWLNLLGNCISYLLVVFIQYVPIRPSEGLLDQVYSSSILQTSSTLLPLLFIILGHTMGSQMKRIFHELNDFDQKLRVISFCAMDYQKHRILIICYQMCLISVTSLVTCSSFFVINNLSFPRVAYLYIWRVMLTWTVVAQQFVVTVWLIIERVKQMNKVFGMYFPKNGLPSSLLPKKGYQETVEVRNEKTQLIVLRHIVVLYDKIVDVVDLVNHCYSIQITICVGVCFSVGVISTFGVFKALLRWQELYFMGLHNIVWGAYYVCIVVIFISAGSQIAQEGKRTGTLVYKGITNCPSSAVKNELNLFSQQLLHRRPIITCGMFVYDWTLMYTLIGATATYLIIMIQFDISVTSLMSSNGTTSKCVP